MQDLLFFHVLFGTFIICYFVFSVKQSVKNKSHFVWQNTQSSITLYVYGVGECLSCHLFSPKTGVEYHAQNREIKRVRIRDQCDRQEGRHALLHVQYLQEERRAQMHQPLHQGQTRWYNCYFNWRRHDRICGANAHAVHDEIEEIYRPFVDFSARKNEKEMLLQKIRLW